MRCRKDMCTSPWPSHCWWSCSICDSEKKLYLRKTFRTHTFFLRINEGTLLKYISKSRMAGLHFPVTKNCKSGFNGKVFAYCGTFTKPSGLPRRALQQG